MESHHVISVSNTRAMQMFIQWNIEQKDVHDVFYF